MESSVATAGAASFGSALSLAQTLAPPKAVDMAAILKAAKLEDLPYVLMVEQPLIGTANGSPIEYISSGKDYSKPG